MRGNAGVLAGSWRNRRSVFLAALPPPLPPQAESSNEDDSPEASTQDPQGRVVNLDFLPKLLDNLPKLLDLWVHPLVQSVLWGAIIGTAIMLRNSQRDDWRAACAEAHSALSHERNGAGSLQSSGITSRQRLKLLHTVRGRRKRRSLNDALAEYDRQREATYSAARLAAIDRLMRMLED